MSVNKYGGNYYSFDQNLPALTTMDLKRVNKISEKYKDVVNGYTHRVQCLFPKDNAYYNIVDVIKHIILLYYFSFSLFESDLLFGQEQDEFFSFLSKNGKNITQYPWKLLCKSSKDSFLYFKCKKNSKSCNYG